MLELVSVPILVLFLSAGRIIRASRDGVQVRIQEALITLSLPNSKSEAARIGSMIIVHLSKRRKAKSSYCVMFYSSGVRLQGKFEIDYSWE